MLDLLRKLHKVFLFTIQRMLFFYIILGIILFNVIDQEYVSLKTLDHLQGTAKAVVAVARGENNDKYQSLRDGVRYYKHFYKAHPDNAAALTAIAFCYDQLGSKDKAIAYYQKALEQQPDLFGAHHNLGRLYYQNGDYHRAVGALTQAVGVSLETVLNVKHRINPYENNFKEGSLSPGEVRVLGIRKAYAMCYRYLVMSYLKLGEEEQARTAALKGLQYAVDDKEFFARQVKAGRKEPMPLNDNEEMRVIYYPPVHYMQVNGQSLRMM